MSAIIKVIFDLIDLIIIPPAFTCNDGERPGGLAFARLGPLPRLRLGAGRRRRCLGAAAAEPRQLEVQPRQVESTAARRRRRDDRGSVDRRRGGGRGTVDRQYAAGPHRDPRRYTAAPAASPCQISYEQQKFGLGGVQSKKTCNHPGRNSIWGILNVICAGVEVSRRKERES